MYQQQIPVIISINPEILDFPSPGLTEMIYEDGDIMTYDNGDIMIY